MIQHYEKKGPWIWRCHLDLTDSNEELWAYLTPFIERYDAVILSLEEYAQALDAPQVFFMPAINPFSISLPDTFSARCFRIAELQKNTDWTR